jgi:hypothetical protein
MPSILVSLHGRRLGFSSSGYLVGDDSKTKGLDLIHGAIDRVTNATSDTTGTNIKGYGLTIVDTSTDDTWLLEAPVIGVTKKIYTGSTSTGIRTIKRVNDSFAIRTSAASTLTTIVAQGGGLMLELLGVSSAIYAIVGRPTGFSSACSTEMALNGTT